MSRLGQVWRGELAQRIESYLALEIERDELIDWAMDHPFFDEHADLDPIEQRVVAAALAAIMQHAPAEPQETRTGKLELRSAIDTLWHRPADGLQ